MIKPRPLHLAAAAVLYAALLPASGLGAPTAHSKAPVKKAAAANQSSFALNPTEFDTTLPATRSYFILQAKPGTVIKRTVRVANTGTAAGKAYVYAVDGTTGQTSGAVYLSRESARADVGAWITISPNSVTLKPGETRDVAFTVRVPRNARPGDHLGGIVAENTELTSPSESGALQIKIRHLTVVAVEVQLPGAAAARLDVTGIKAGGEHGYQFLYLHMRNKGGVTLKPSGSITIVGANGKTVASRDFQLDTFVPRTAIDYPLLLPREALRAGSYRANIRVTYGSAAIGYRLADGPTRQLFRSFGFKVSPSQYTQVFQGVAPLTKPGSGRSGPGKSGGGGNGVLIVGLGLGACLLVGGAGFFFVRRRGLGGLPKRIRGLGPRPGGGTTRGVEDDGTAVTKSLLAAYGSDRVAGEVIVPDGQVEDQTPPTAEPVEEAAVEEPETAPTAYAVTEPVAAPEPVVMRAAPLVSNAPALQQPERPSSKFAVGVGVALGVAAVVAAYVEGHSDPRSGKGRS